MKPNQNRTTCFQSPEATVEVSPRFKLLKAFGALAALFSISCGALATPLDFNKTFESSLQMNCSGNCPTVSKKYAREGDSSMKAYINRNSSPNSYRAEAVIPGKAKKMEFNRDYWYGFSVYLPEDWQVTGKNEVLAQFHSTLDKGDAQNGPPVAIRTGTGNWEIVNRAEGDQRAGGRLWTLNNVWEDVGKWTDWVIHFKPSYEANGVLRIWKNGALVAQHYGKNTYNDQVGPYFKMGLYMNWKNRSCCDPSMYKKSVYHDSLRIASGPNAGYFDVAPRGDAPLEPVGGNPAAQEEPEEANTSTAVNTTSTDTSGSSQQATTDNTAGSSTASAPNSGAEYVEIANLSHRQTVSGKIKIVVDTNDPDGIKRVVVRADNKQKSFLIGRKTAAPWEFTLDTEPYASGPRLRIQAVVIDMNGKKQKDVVRVFAK